MINLFKIKYNLIIFASFIILCISLWALFFNKHSNSFSVILEKLKRINENNISINNPLEANSDISNIVFTLSSESNLNTLFNAIRIYNWLILNVTYNKNFYKEKPKTAIETFNERNGNCLEECFLYYVMGKIIKLNLQFVKINIDSKGRFVDHV